MTNDEILDLLKEAFQVAAPEQAAAVDSLTMESMLGEFGVSSIIALEMAGYIEEKLEIQFPDDELDQISSIKSFVKLIQKHTKALV
ncbi:acyl carrier protein [Nostoc sp. PCC 7524]|jgi:acyl carrier protein|uniref:acyl carrier protein n=1 Tax=Nostoc sp. (strain ATCC 29411 / PCC 7524) TaxID=28072 RepID=UPI00029F2EB3|nr:acyl carrier protein [Nostoc sp. PCC 7524]AFY47233.1 acyl carrier protein [Nostoc sp. PCC 7524]